MSVCVCVCVCACVVCVCVCVCVSLSVCVVCAAHVLCVEDLVNRPAPDLQRWAAQKRNSPRRTCPAGP